MGYVSAERWMGGQYCALYNPLMYVYGLFCPMSKLMKLQHINRSDVWRTTKLLVRGMIQKVRVGLQTIEQCDKISSNCPGSVPSISHCTLCVLLEAGSDSAYCVKWWLNGLGPISNTSNSVTVSVCRHVTCIVGGGVC